MVWILGAMIIGVVCGKFAPVLRDRFAVAELYGTPLPIAVGLWLMMWPVLSKVRGTSACVIPGTEGRQTKPGPMFALPQRASVVACICTGGHGRSRTLGMEACTVAAVLCLPVISQGGRRIRRWHGFLTE